MMPMKPITKISAARTAKKRLLDRERMTASLGRPQPFVEQAERGSAMDEAAGDPHDEPREALVVDGIEADPGDAHRRIICVPWARRQTHQRSQCAADQRSCEEAGSRDTIAIRARPRVKHRPPEQ